MRSGAKWPIGPIRQSALEMTECSTELDTEVVEQALPHTQVVDAVRDHDRSEVDPC